MFTKLLSAALLTTTSRRKEARRSGTRHLRRAAHGRRSIDVRTPHQALRFRPVLSGIQPRRIFDMKMPLLPDQATACSCRRRGSVGFWPKPHKLMSGGPSIESPVVLGSAPRFGPKSSSFFATRWGRQECCRKQGGQHGAARDGPPRRPCIGGPLDDLLFAIT